jgi:restriction endonuclease S subunit
MSNRVLQLKELVQIFQGVTLNRYQDDQGSQERIINSRNLEQIYISGELSTVQINAASLSQYRLHTGDVVITIRGTPLKASVVTDKVQGCLPNQNLAVLRPKIENINPVFLAVLMRSKWLEQHLVTLYNQSIGTQMLKISQLRGLEIPLPNLNTQNKLAQLFLAAEHYSQKTLETIEVRNSLVQLTFSRILKGEQ